MKKTIIWVIVAAVIVGGGVWLLTSSNDKTPDTSTNTTSTPAPEPTSPATNETEKTTEVTTITYNDGGFSPSNLTVKTGTVITVKNDSSGKLQFSSDPHPQHTENEELNAKTLEPGASETLTLNTKGTFGVHDHLNASQKATVTVQ